MNGGRQKQDLCGVDQVFLSIYLFIYPDAGSDGFCLFVVANGDMVYSRHDISKNCAELDLIRKQSSQEAYKVNCGLCLSLHHLGY